MLWQLASDWLLLLEIPVFAFKETFYKPKSLRRETVTRRVIFYELAEFHIIEYILNYDWNATTPEPPRAPIPHFLFYPSRFSLFPWRRVCRHGSHHTTNTEMSIKIREASEGQTELTWDHIFPQRPPQPRSLGEFPCFPLA